MSNSHEVTKVPAYQRALVALPKTMAHRPSGKTDARRSRSRRSLERQATRSRSLTTDSIWPGKRPRGMAPGRKIAVSPRPTDVQQPLRQPALAKTLSIIAWVPRENSSGQG
jgi:hypothetical protein